MSDRTDLYPGALVASAPPESQAGRVQQALPYSAQAANIIRAAILNGEYKMGQRLNEVELSASLGISRSPIRESLRTLAEEGLVKLVSGRGVFVASFPVEEVRDLLELRLALDVLAIRLAAVRATPEDLTRLESTLDNLAAAHKDGDVASLGWSSDFHLGIFLAAHNGKLYEHGRSVHGQLRLVRFRSGGSVGRIAEAHSEHADLLDAIRTRDELEAERRMTLHLAEASAHILQVHEEREDG